MLLNSSTYLANIFSRLGPGVVDAIVGTGNKIQGLFGSAAKSISYLIGIESDIKTEDTITATELANVIYQQFMEQVFQQDEQTELHVRDVIEHTKSLISEETVDIIAIDKDLKQMIMLLSNYRNRIQEIAELTLERLRYLIA